MDIQMPHLDGIEATKKVRQCHTDVARIPIIGLTAHALKGDRERFLEAGMNDYISKPIDKELLLEKIAVWTAQESSDIQSGDGHGEIAGAVRGPHCLAS
jgi:CheY-like chemotaxis protein